MGWLHAVLDLPVGRRDEVVGFWSAALGWPVGASYAGRRSFEPADGSAYVHVEATDGAPGVHLELEADDPDALAERARGLGAERVATDGHRHRLRSPGGLALDVGPAQERVGPAPVTWPGGHRSRLVQVCVDAPVEAHGREVAFWTDLLDGRWVPSSSPEFAGKWHDDAGSPLQLLFQRLDEPRGVVRAHLDLGTDDLPAEVARLHALGAADVGPGRGWHALRDPAGTAFCVTGNDPAYGRRRLG